jgi:hypothetical protein
MNYLLMCCIDEARWTGLPESERDQVMKEYGELQRKLVDTGCYRGGGRLESVSTATTVRERNGRPIITDGPFAETKEQLGGYHVVDCKDLDEAIAIALRIPTLRVGGAVEVRPLGSTVHVERSAA